MASLHARRENPQFLKQRDMYHGSRLRGLDAGTLVRFCAHTLQMNTPSYMRAQHMLLEVDGACCSQKSCASWMDDPAFKCSPSCAAVVLPFFERCQAVIDSIWDVFGKDRTIDGKASPGISTYHLPESRRLTSLTIIPQVADP